MEEFNFGAVEKYDENAYDLSKLGTAGEVEPVKIDYSKVPIVHQHKQPACGSHTGSSLEAMLSLAVKHLESISNSPRCLWKFIKDIDGYPIETGTDMISIFKALKGKGVCSIETMPNASEKLSLAEYRSPVMTNEILEEAFDNRIEAYAVTYSPTFEQIKDAIDKYGAIIIQYRCGKNMYRDKNDKPSWKAKDILPLSPDRFTMDSGHFVVGINKYPERKNQIWFRNSWGDEWGEKGDGYFEKEYVKYVYAIGTAVKRDELNLEATKYKFYRNLQEGMRDEDVRQLQVVLNKLGFTVALSGVGSPGKESTYFGPLTKQAVVKFQEAHRDEILKPFGLVRGTGIVGSKTIKVLNSLI